MNFLPYLMGLAALLQVIFVPMYIKKCWPKKNRTSLVIKMICSSLFVSAAVMAMFYAENTSAYAVLILCGLIFSWLGDFFLHVSEKMTFFLIGLFCFLGGHIFYVSAYSLAVDSLFGVKFFSLIDIIVVAVLTGIAVIYKVKTKMHLGRAAIPALIYTMALTTMTAKACHLAIVGLSADPEFWLVPALLLIFGSVMFTMSDSTLAMINFGGKKQFGIKAFNSVTYFAAQMCIAFTILFIR